MSRVCLLSLAALLVCACAYEDKPEVVELEGGIATLRCRFDVSWLRDPPPPKITWKFGEHTIDGNASRYTLKSDGALEIVSLYRNDSGVYKCVADNGLRVATQEIHLVVNDPVRMAAGIVGDENASVTSELGKPHHVRCLAYGFPPPVVFWYRGYEETVVLYNDAEYEVRGNDLIIRSLSMDNLGQYTCEAYNGVGQAATWVVAVRAYMPRGIFSDSEWLVSTTTTEAPRPLFTETSIAGELTVTTEETMASFETNEHSTTNEDTTDVIGATTLDPCSGFEFGCCADNETEASGPDGQGCPCNATEFGCCADGVSPAAGRENEGCSDPCSTSPYGCCQDEKTPAHGPDFEGCCLLQECWPDNRKPAEGPHIEVVKAGAGPMDETTTTECRRECSDDADCRGVGKCCRRGCSDICLVPVEQTSPHPILITVVARNVSAVPQALPPQEAEVSASEGGVATLRCLFYGNPPPKITWRFGEVAIDDNVGRYRLSSDGALEIVSLYRNDTGVYICVADNGLGVATQEIHLAVNDPVRTPVGIAGDEHAVVIGELGSPLIVRCLAYGYPPPSVYWSRRYGSVMVPYNDAVYESRGNVLLIRSLAIETLGQYTCQAYNGEGKAASWGVFVLAYMPEGLFIDNELLVPRNPLVPRPRTQPPTTTSTTTKAPRPFFTVPVSTHLSTPFSTLNIGADLHLTCDVDGFPEPDVHWTKDGGIIQTDGRITITGSTIVSRLTVTRVSVADSGLYACHASNAYSSQSDTAQINVQQLLVPAKCTDNPFFANCDLIVRSKFCRHKYYSKHCCKSCVEAGQLDLQEAELIADRQYWKKNN